MITSIYLKLVHALISLKYKLFGIKYSEIYNVESKKGYWSFQKSNDSKNGFKLHFNPINLDDVEIFFGNQVHLNLKNSELEDLIDLVNKLKK